MKKAVRFFNTFSPVVPLYEDIAAPLLKRGIRPRFVVSEGRYRQNSQDMTAELGNTFERCWVPKVLRGSKRMSSVFYYAIAPIILLFKRADLHVFLTQPPLFFLLGAFLSRIRRVPYGIHVMDMYPELFAVSGLLREDSLFYRMLERIALKSYQKADFIVVLGRCMRDRLIDKGVPDGIIHIVYNWSVIESADVAPKNSSYRTRHELEDKLVVMYSGNIGVAHDMTPLLEAACRLKENKDIVFLIVGHGVGRKAVETFIESHSLNNVLLWDTQPESRLKELISSADIHYVTLKKEYEGLMVPSKLYSILACGRPVFFVGGKDSEVVRIVEEHGCGIHCGSDAFCLARQIERATHDRSWLEELGRNAVAAADEVSKRKMIKKYISIIDAEVSRKHFMPPFA